MNDYSLIYKHGRARLGVGAGLVHPAREGDPAALGPGTGSGNGGQPEPPGLSGMRLPGERSGPEPPEQRGFLCKRCPPKKPLYKMPLAMLSAHRNHA